MEAKSFTILKESVLSLFENDPIGYHYKYLDFLPLGVSGEWLTNQIGSITCFHDLLKIELNRFFENFNEYFETSDCRMKTRREFEYERLIKRKLCRRGPFKRNLFDFIIQDLKSCFDLQTGEITDEYKVVAARQKVAFASIENYIFRAFFILECYSVPA